MHFYNNKSKYNKAKKAPFLAKGISTKRCESTLKNMTPLTHVFANTKSHRATGHVLFYLSRSSNPRTLHICTLTLFFIKAARLLTTLFSLKGKAHKTYLSCG